MNRYLIAVLAIVILGSCARTTGHQSGGGDARYMQRLYDNAVKAVYSGDYNVSDSLGRELYRTAALADNDYYRICGLLAQSYSRQLIPDRRERFKYLREAERLMPEVGNDSLASHLYNYIGVCSMDSLEEAKAYYLKAMEAGRRANYKARQIVAECNLAEVYRLSQDTLGIRYDRDIFDYAEKVDNEVMLRASAVRCAEYYISMGNLETASYYIDRLKGLRDDFDYNYLKALWLLEDGNVQSAITHWQRASESGITTPLYFMVGGRIYQANGEYALSDSLLTAADGAFASIDSLRHDRVSILRLRAENLSRMADAFKAMSMWRRYALASDSLHQVNNRNQVNSLKVRFDTYKKEAEIASQRESLRLRNLLMLTVGVFSVLAVMGMGLYVRRRNKFYRLVASREKEFLTRIEEYSPYVTSNNSKDTTSIEATEALDDSQSEHEAVTKTVSTGLPPKDKADAIWQSIINEMEINHIYADPNVTRDSFAEKIGTNHTWFTAIIKSRTGKNYSQFMNSWRINEAVRILSTAPCSLTNKALAAQLGFMTPQSFYSTFKVQMGMSPTRFRENMAHVDE